MAPGQEGLPGRTDPCGPTRAHWRLARHALLAVLLAAAAGCWQRSVPLEDAPLPFRQAEDNFRLGNYDKAVRSYQTFLDSEASDEYPELIPRAYYRMATAEYRRGRYNECLAALDRMERRLPNKQWPQVDELRGDAELARGNPISALHWWEEGWKIAEGEDKREAHQHIADALDRMDQSTLTQARGVMTTKEMRALVDEHLTSPGSPAPRTSAAPAKAPEPAAPAPSPAAPSPLGEDTGPPPRVGVLLPLSGPFATYGQRSLNGIKLAFGAQADGLVVRDDQGEPQVGRSALDELAADPTIGVVLGPLRSKVAETVAPRAEHAGLPLVVLAQQEGIEGRWIVQPGMTADRQCAELAEYAIGNQRLRKFGVLYPNTPYGRALADAFRHQVEQRGGQVVGSLSYDPKQKEFSVELLSADKWIKDDGLQAVFIPDFAATAVTLATQLRHTRADLVLLGGNGWDDPAALAPAANTIDGAVFVDGFFSSSQRRATQDFVAAYKTAYGSTPDILEAQAFDAAKLVAAAVQTGARSRAQVIAALETPRTFDGAAGAVAVGPQGVQRQLFLLRVSNGTITEVPAGRPPSAPPPLPVAGSAAPQ